MKKIFIIFIVFLFLINCEKEKKQVVPFQSIVEKPKNGTIITVPANPNQATGGSTLGDVVPLVSVDTTPNQTEPFTYDTTNTIPVNMTVTDSNGNPISPSVVSITDPNQNDAILLQQVTNPSGTVTGNITVPTTTTTVNVTVSIGGATSDPATVPLQVVVNNNGTPTITPVTCIGNVVIPISNPSSNVPPIADRDGDGIEDSKDAYPDDPTKATKIRFPSTGVNTIAFEDLFPNAGDADLNDYVIQFFNEEDLNAKGEIVEVRGAYQHVARGAGYTHKLKLLFPSSVSIQYETSVTNSAGVAKPSTAIYTPTSAQISAGLEILGDSSTTISSPNSNLGQTYAPGDISKIKVKFNTPVARSVIGAAPYNIYMNVISTGKDVFFPGKYFDELGNDKFMDANGFPWAILVPGIWQWPLESQDIRNSSVTGYPKFQSWANSKGLVDKDWYKTVTTGKVFPIPLEPSSLLAYISNNLPSNMSSISILLVIVGISFGLIARRKLKLN